MIGLSGMEQSATTLGAGRDSGGGVSHAGHVDVPGHAACPASRRSRITAVHATQGILFTQLQQYVNIYSSNMLSVY